MTFAILVDKSGVLENASYQAEERRAKMSEAQGALIAAMVQATFDDLGVSIPGPLGNLLRHYAFQSTEGQVVSGTAPEDVVEAAREGLVGQVVRGLSDEQVREEASRRGLVDSPVPALPSAPRPAEDASDVEGDEPEVIDEGEIVDEGTDQEASGFYMLPSGGFGMREA